MWKLKLCTLRGSRGGAPSLHTFIMYRLVPSVLYVYFHGENIIVKNDCGEILSKRLYATSGTYCSQLSRDTIAFAGEKFSITADGRQVIKESFPLSFTYRLSYTHSVKY